MDWSELIFGIVFAGVLIVTFIIWHRNRVKEQRNDETK